jgi:hypothetical protein
LQHKAFRGQHPVHRRRADVHQIQAGAAGGELAVGAVDAGPGPEQLQDRGPLGLEQAVHRAAAARQVREPSGAGPVSPCRGPVRVQAEQRAGTPRRPARVPRVNDEGQQPAFAGASTRGGTGPAVSPNALSLVQVQRHRLLGHRRPQPVDLKLRRPRSSLLA